MQELQYPIGKFSYPIEHSELLIHEWTETLAHFPSVVKDLVANLSGQDLLKTYRPGGWNILQTVHHCADSHMNAYIRLKLALTEDDPIIKPYLENLWAKLPDTELSPVSNALQILEGIHFRWNILLFSLSHDAWLRTYTHPETKRKTTIWEMTALYAWHAKHHTAHIQLAKSS